MNRLFLILFLLSLIGCKEISDRDTDVEPSKSSVENNFTFLNDFPDTLKQNSLHKNSLIFERIKDSTVIANQINDSIITYYEYLFVYNFETEDEIPLTARKLPLDFNEFDFKGALVFIPKTENSIEFEMKLTRKGYNYLVFDFYNILHYPTHQNDYIRVKDKSSRYIERVYVE
jgi:hypothetical protein